MRQFILPAILISALAAAPAAAAEIEPPIVGVKIYEPGEDPTHLIDSWRRLGIDTAFVSVAIADAEELIPALRTAGMESFIITPVFYNPDYLEAHPEAWAITGRGRKARDDWVEFVCPSREDYRSKRMELVLDLLRDHRPDGLSLDFIRHFVFWETVGPNDAIDSLDTTCFCDHCIARFQRETEIRIPAAVLLETETTARWLLEHERHAWQDWRAGLITTWVRELAARARQIDPEILISLHLVPWGRDDYDDGLLRVAGQDLEALGGIVDLVSPMTYAHMLRRDPEWVATLTAEIASRVQVSVVPSIQVRESYLEIELTDDSFARALGAALRPPSAGVVLWSWPHLEQEPAKQRILGSSRSGGERD